jgi:ketosteroid isomerase-like protein
MHPNEELYREAIAAFQRGDMDALRTKYFAEDICYRVHGRSPVSGEYNGAAEVIGLFGRLFELSGGTLRIELHDVVANDDHTVAMFSAHAERNGRQLNVNEVQIVHPTPDGKAGEVWTSSSDPYTFDEFWS